MAVKKIRSGEASFISEQEFETVEDAYKDQNPKAEPVITVTDVKFDHTRIKKEVKENVLGQQDRTSK